MSGRPAANHCTPTGVTESAGSRWVKADVQTQACACVSMWGGGGHIHLENRAVGFNKETLRGGKRPPREWRWEGLMASRIDTGDKSIQEDEGDVSRTGTRGGVGG